ncbi:HCL033Cp [Eremothecium sinecaudum]|uniref:Protein transport protein SEC22 n=1 Tax=Eremothecium sinecaudum TaxID=45286 RepID=A0A109UZD4_9SACH|nr:HCL033Cp [Eremothecium sinecaudum]AMD20118.1 HCL033Cp [Eremothecium sinecaudum]
MIKSTLIFREDGLPFCSSVDDDTDPGLADQKKKVKVLVSRFTPTSANEATIESGAYEIHYIRHQTVVYLVIVEQGCPRNLAFAYLSDIRQEFEHNYGHEYLKADVRPYAFVSFDNFLEKTKKLYNDKRVQGSLDQLNNDLRGVREIMTKNIEDLLYRGDSLDRMSDLSATLRADSRKYRQSARQINWDLMLSQYGPIVLIALLVVGAIWWMFLR